MAVSAAERAQLAWDAGFRNTDAVEALSIIVAISMAECGVGSASGCETGCVDVLGDLTCGLVQVDCVYHTDCRTCADPAAAFGCAWAISNHGTSFTPWATFTGGEFRQYLPAARAAVAAITPVPVPTPPYIPPPPPHHTLPPPSNSDASVLLLLAGVGLVGFALERTRPGSITGILRSAPSAGGIRSGSVRPILRP